MDVEVRERKDIPKEFTWNAESVFEDTAAWRAEYKAIAEDLGQLERVQGKLGEGPQVLLEAIQLIEELATRAFRVQMYAYMSHAVNTEDQQAAEMQGQAQGLIGQTLGAISFFDPELLSVGKQTLDEWVQRPELEPYAHYVDDLFRKQQHIRSAEVEQLLGMLEGLFLGARTTAESLVDADFRFKPAVDSEGEEIPLSQGSLGAILTRPDRQARRTAWENYADKYLEFKNSLAANLANSIRQFVFKARARRHQSSLEHALFEFNIPEPVFHNLIASFRENVGVWHRYFEVKRKALGVERLQPYDVWAPVIEQAPEVSFEQAVEWVCEGLEPMGEEYVSTMRQGCTEHRWVDVYPNQGKRQGAFSYGTPGNHPFIVMSYKDNVLSLSTLAHELGHSMHSYLAWRNQPVIYGRYSIFAAEVASNFHQAMVRSHLLANTDDRALKIHLIEEAMSNFYRYFLTMPTLARFELETHQRVERGEGLNADGMIELVSDLYQEPYGSVMAIDRQRVGISWAQYLHMYTDYYVYQYATGIAGAHALSERVLSGESGAVDDYLGFLKAGGAEYPLEALRAAGVDLSSPEPVQQTFQVMASYVDQLEQLLG